MRIVRWLGILIVAGYGCGGCVAYQIRDELRATNQQLEKVNGRLDTMAAELKEMHETVSKSNGELVNSNKSLTSIDSSMDPIRVSLHRIDDEMAAFREVIDKITKDLPGHLGPSTPPPAKEAPTQEVTPGKK